MPLLIVVHFILTPLAPAILKIHTDVTVTNKQDAQPVINPDDCLRLALEKADIRVCHEPPAGTQAGTERSEGLLWQWARGWPRMDAVMTV